MKKEEIIALTDQEREALINQAIEARRVRNARPEEMRVAERAAAKVAAGERLTVNEFESLTGVMFSHHMTGKMLNILALSTNCLGNPVCIARMKAGIGICAECFAASVESQYSGVFENTSYNYEVLSSMIIPLAILPVIDADELRIESFGDVANWKQAANYMNIACVNPLVHVTAWTKNLNCYHEAIKRGYSKPANFTLIYSSLELNTPSEIPAEYAYLVDKRFTVYTLEWLDANNLGPCFINCGGRSCKACQRCYCNADNTGFDVRELLKSDAKKAAKRGGMWASWIDADNMTDDMPAVTSKAARDVLALFGKA